METAAQVALIGLGLIVVAHYLEGGGDQVSRYARYLFTGIGPDGSRWNASTSPAPQSSNVIPINTRAAATRPRTT